MQSNTALNFRLIPCGLPLVGCVSRVRRFSSPKVPPNPKSKKKKKKVSHGQQGPLHGSSSSYGTLSQRGLLDPIKLAHDQRRPDGRLRITASAFNRLGQYAGSPGHRTYCYAELAVSCLVMAETIASTHYAYARRDGQAELTWVAG